MRHFVPRTGLIAIGWALLFAACAKDTPPARAQWLIEVQTDAPVPTVVDRILIELLDESGALACPSCRRDAPAHDLEEVTAKGAVSFGVEATTAALYLRTRMYRNDHLSAATGQPDPGLTLDSIVRLPPVGDQVMRVYANLELACLGQPALVPGSGAWSTCVKGSMQPPPDAATQPPDASFGPGSSELLQGVRRGCGGAQKPDDGMTCVPGGVFFLGSAMAPAPHSDVRAAPIPERLVGVDSFGLDLHEVTVGDLEDFLTTLPTLPIQLPTCEEAQPTSGAVRLWCRDASRNTQAYCTRSTDQASRNHPLNCVSVVVAALYCAARKGRLPTEAEWEYAASNGAQETRYPWGDTRPDSCDYSALAREPGEVGKEAASECVSRGPGPAARWENGLLDLTRSWGPDDKSKSLPIFDLGGNVSEWTSDFFESYEVPSEADAGAAEAGSAESGGAEAGMPEAGPEDAGAGRADRCWATDEVILKNRRCGFRKGAKMVVRGGSWRETLDGAWSANRASLSAVPGAPSQEVGFRCACDLNDEGNCCLKNDAGKCCALSVDLVTKQVECCAAGECCPWDVIGGRCCAGKLVDGRCE